jgi:hypothetical protein
MSYSSFKSLAVRRFVRVFLAILTWLLFFPAARAQSCFNGPELEASTRNAIEMAARRYADMSAQGDVAGLKANAIPAITGDFGSIEQAAVTNKQFFAQGQPTITGTYLLDASQAKGPLPRADFYCGIYNSPDRIGFFIPNLPPGRYAIVFQKVAGKDPITLTLILQEMTGAWKLAGYYPRLDAIGGHDGQWYLAKAREFKAKGQSHNAWLYYQTAWDLLAPVNFMSTPQLDKVADEMQAARPSDVPAAASPLSLSVNNKTFRLTEITAVTVGDNLDVRAQYQTPDAANSGLAFQDNLAVIKALVAKYPELRDAFYGVVARAMDDNGHEFVSIQPMKDIK